MNNLNKKKAISLSNRWRTVEKIEYVCGVSGRGRRMTKGKPWSPELEKELNDLVDELTRQPELSECLD